VLEDIRDGQTPEEKEQCAGCYANPSADAQVHLQGVCLQSRRQRHACGGSRYYNEE